MKRKNQKWQMRIYFMKYIFIAIAFILFTTKNSAQEVQSIKYNYLSVFWNAGHANASVISQDGGYSYKVKGGSLWWFGDTFKGRRDSTGQPHFNGAVSCSVAMLGEENKNYPPKLKFLVNKDSTASQAIEFIQNESWDHNRIWPLAGIYVNGKSYIFYSLIEITGKGEWDFKSAGSGLAFSAKPLAVHKRIVKNEDWRYPVSPTAIIADHEWLYLFEVEKRGNKNGIWLARVNGKDIENKQAYEFYCGGEELFNKDKGKQIIFMENIYGQVSVAWNEYLNKFILVSSSDFFNSRDIRFYTADKPYGPWTKLKQKITMPDTLQGKKVNLVYCSFLHPELFREKGRIMNLTFSVNLEKSGFDANNEMIEIELNSTEK